MNLRDIKYLLAVAETLHFGKAAERCFISQPTLSGQIKKLEDELGVTIFERTNRAVAITAVGERILTHVRLLLEQVDAIQIVAQAHRDPLAGPLRVGIIPTLSPYLLPLILEPLQLTYPQLKLVISEEITENLLNNLRCHEIDAALLATMPTDQDFVIKQLFDEPFWLAYPKDHPIQNKALKSQKDLDGIELLLLADGHCLAQQVMQVCKQTLEKGSSNIADLRATSLETLIQLVRARFGCTLVPALAVAAISKSIGADIVIRPLQIKDATRRIQLVYRNTYPRMQAILKFAKIIRQFMPDTVQVLKSI
ncbi:LysR family transcriptional regulator [Achromatium sp. WMS3]|nr:LysR family transcriptional regulator [Achromatium sp. WMS3]